MSSSYAPVIASDSRVSPQRDHASPPAAQGSHIAALDGLRGLAIALVLLHHCSPALEWTPASPSAVKIVNKFACFSFCGVDLFFVLSGFLITGILLRSRSSRNYFKSFYARRALRIFPLYYGVLFLALCIGAPLLGSTFANQFGPEQERCWLWLYGTNLVQGLHNSWVYGHLRHLWSLAVEEHFYLLWPVLVFALKDRRLITICIAGFLAGPLMRYVVACPLHDMIGAYVLTFCRADGLLLGCLIALASQSQNFANKTKWIKPAALAMLLLLPVYACCVLQQSATDRVLSPTVFGAFFGMLLVLTTQTKFFTPVFEFPFLRFLGRYSYGIYVYHGLVVAEFEKRNMFHWLGSSIPNYICFFAIVLAISLTVSIVSYELYEVHFLKLKRYFTA